jgi:phage-related protein
MRNVASESPTLVMPFGLCKVFSQVRTGVVEVNEYGDGSTQRRSVVTDSRRAWQISRRLTQAQLEALEAFASAVRGPHVTFWFYDPSETAPRFRYDETGASSIGRYCVRLSGGIELVSTVGRAEASFQLLEVAG